MSTKNTETEGGTESETARLQALAEALPLHLLNVKLLVRRKIVLGRDLPDDEVQELLDRATELLGACVDLERRLGR